MGVPVQGYEEKHVTLLTQNWMKASGPARDVIAGMSQRTVSAADIPHIRAHLAIAR